MENIVIKLQHLFEVDNRIKKEMYNSVPPSDEGYLDANSLCTYTDSLNDVLMYIFSELKCITLDFFGADPIALKTVENLESTVKQNFYECGLDINALRKFYKQYISDMSLTFVDEVKDKCVGYTLFNDLPFDRVTTINEMLHLVHAYVVNNDMILQSVPKINEKKNKEDYPITLRGYSTEVFQNLYKSFPINLDIGWTDLVCINERKMLIMVRDKGHALTFEVTLRNDNTARVEYFIPKICNVDMVNALPGINKVNNDSIGATGVFETSILQLNEKIFYIIEKTPTDKDMILDEYLSR